MDVLVERALERLKPALGADGVQLDFQKADGSNLYLILRASNADVCADCIVESDVMEEIVLAALHQTGADYSAVHITDELNRTKGQP